jgi:tetratricopeptide (TPR) repeat protein
VHRKSQLAIEYCYRLRERSPHTWVFWIHASNADRIEQGYREIAERVKIPGRKDPQENIFELVARWLRDDAMGSWLLVLDNLDDDVVLSTPYMMAEPKMLSGNSDGQLRRSLSVYLPQSKNGAILVTTRTRSVATKLVEPRDVIAVDSMTTVEATMLLESKLDGQADIGDLGELVHMLECIPLAIVQAAAYIQQKGSRYNVRKYIEEFQKNERRKTSLLNYEAGHLRRDQEAKNSIVITWQISFDEIRDKCPSSADLLSLMSFFDRQGIPEEVLKVQVQKERTGDIVRRDIVRRDMVRRDMVRRDMVKRDEDSNEDDGKDEDDDIKDSGASEATSDDTFEEDVDRLRSYSFVSVGDNGRTLDMHGLVQLATRKWLEMYGQDEKWRAQFSRKLNAVFPTGEHKNWGQCEMLFPHAKSAERQRPVEDKSVRQWAQLLRKAGWYAWAKGDYREAERMCEKSAGALRKVLGGEDVETSYSLGLLALVYRYQGRWTEAEQMFVQVVETRRRVLGEEHPDTLTSMANLASTYRDQGRWTEAEQMEVQVVETRMRVLGEEHPDTLTSMNNLASTYRNQGRWTEAEQMFVQVMETRKRVLGEKHPDTLTSMANLASTYRNQGRWTEAEQMFVQVMETRKRVLGEKHPDTLTSMANLASTYRNQGRWTEAEQMFMQVMETRMRVLGEEHPDTLTSIANLASTYRNQGRWTEAEQMFMQVMETRKRVLGEKHPDTLTSIANLASTYRNQGRWTEAEQMFVQVMETRKRVLGEEHPDTLTSMANLASTYRNQRRWTEAEKIEVQVMETRRRVLGEEHPDTVTSMNDLASIRQDHGRLSEAEKSSYLQSLTLYGTGSHKFVLELRFWNHLKEFFESEFDPPWHLDDIIVIVRDNDGDENTWCTTCKNYIDWRWGSFGSDVLIFVNSLLIISQSHTSGSDAGVVLNTDLTFIRIKSLHAAVILQLLSRSDMPSILVKGPRQAAEEVTNVLGWIFDSLSLPQIYDKIVHGDKSVVV